MKTLKSLKNLEIVARLELGNSILPFKGRIERVSPEVTEGGSGRQIFASIELENYKFIL